MVNRGYVEEKILDNNNNIHFWHNFPALAKKKSEELIFSDDDDDLLGGLGIEEKGSAPKPKATVSDKDEEENRPAKSVFDKLLGKDSSVSKHLEQKAERREFVLDAKYTKQGRFVLGRLF